jgi:hypothetical protein
MSLHEHSGRDQGSFLTSPAGLVLIGFLVIAGILLFTEHRAHVLVHSSGCRFSCAR